MDSKEVKVKIDPATLEILDENLRKLQNSSPTYQQLRSEPALLDSSGWRRSALYRDQLHNRPPSQTIGSHYSLPAQDLSLRWLRRLTKPNKRLHLLRSLHGCSGNQTKTEAQDIPLSPLHQKALIPHTGAPDWDLEAEQRYLHYLCSIPEEALEINLLPREWVARHLGEKVKKLKFYPEHLDHICQQIKDVYCSSIRRAIINYVLLDPLECQRLHLRPPPPPTSCSVLRAPVPWHDSYIRAKRQMATILFSASHLAHDLRLTWHKMLSNFNFFDTYRLQALLPLNCQQLEDFLQEEVRSSHNFLVHKWLPECADSVDGHIQEWAPLVHAGQLPMVQAYFNMVALNMSFGLHTTLRQSVKTWLHFFSSYKKGNAMPEGTFDLFTFPVKPLLVVKAAVRDSKIVIDPSLDTCVSLLLRSVHHLVAINRNVPRVEKLLFSDTFEHSLKPLDMEDVMIQECYAQIEAILKSNYNGPTQYLKEFQPFLHLLDGSSAQEVDHFLENHKLLGKVTEQINYFEEIYDEILDKPSFLYLNLFALDVSELKDELMVRIRHLIDTILAFKKTELQNHIRNICQQFDEMSSRLCHIPQTTQEMVDIVEYLKLCVDIKLYDANEEIVIATRRLLFLLDYAVFTEADDLQLNCRLFEWPRDIHIILEVARMQINEFHHTAEAELHERHEAFKASLAGLEKVIFSFTRKEMVTHEEMARNVSMLNNFGDQLQDLLGELNAINEQEFLLGWDKSTFPTIPKLMTMKEPFLDLWGSALQFSDCSLRWMNGPFIGLKSDEIEDSLEDMWGIMHRLVKKFTEHPPPRRVAEFIKTQIDGFKVHLPLLHIICNPGMKERHWQRVAEVIGQELHVTKDSSLKDMLDKGLDKYISKLDEISTTATKEYNLEKALDKMKTEWKEILFEFDLYRETGIPILAAVDDIQAMLDDHILKVQTMRGSPFIKPFEEEVKEWEETLLLVQDVLDAWLKCQATWLYLEPIFSSEDIMKQMPEEGQKFSSVNNSWKSITQAAAVDPHVLVAAPHPELLEQLKKCNVLLEEIQKGLNEYLEKKRLVFPRFFFLSNDELLEILSETKDPRRVQPHLKKCFEGISLLSFSPTNEILGMISSEGEVVAFTEKILPARAKGMVEKWLMEVERAMFRCLKAIVGQALLAVANQLKTKWVMEWPGQVVHCVSAILWTAEVAAALEAPETVQEFYKNYGKRSSDDINGIIELLRGELETAARITLSALVVLDMHAREVVTNMATASVSSAEDFTWLSQLRYAWHKLGLSIYIVTTTVDYGFEYLGNSPRLVITPLTERCYQTLMGALKLNLGGAPEGPSGTGKTETCKDLAKAVAKQCVVFNCSEGVDLPAMSKFFKGLAQAGAWACFDECQQLATEVLSVVAHQVQTIQHAAAQQLSICDFEGVDLRLNPTCAMFITVSPGCRPDLPLSLKVLFRTVAMMAPDSTLISELSLFSLGFLEAKILATKVVALYRLGSEQLSLQPHYDYSLRAIKAVITAAGNLRLQYPEVSEQSLVVCAAREVNIPKLLVEDVPLFESILSDLFPDTELFTSDNTALMTALKKVLEGKKLQPVEWFLNKIVQIYQLLKVRHGLMLVGDHMGGKTTAYQCLAEAFGTLETEGEAPVVYSIINPKSISLAQLYGAFDPVSLEWTDGALATIFREYANSTSPERKWIVFDGPVDMEWVENMNTVLDDNKKLCLMSGEIIAMNPTMSILFEPAELTHASPATVSRCGVVYMEPSQLGWGPLHMSHTAAVAQRLTLEQWKLVAMLVDWLVPAAVEFISGCELPTSPLHMVHCFHRLYSSLLNEVFSIIDPKAKGSQNAILTNCQIQLLFALVWGLGGTLNRDDRKRYDILLKDLLAGNVEERPKPKLFKLQKNQIYPEKGSVYDFVFRIKTVEWVRWLDLLTAEELHLPSDVRVSDLMVPTDETVRQFYFLDLFLKYDVPLLFIGPGGTGKSTLMKHYLVTLSQDRFITIAFNFSAHTSAMHTQDIIMSKLDRRRKGVFGPGMGRKCVVFIDDLNLPERDAYDSQPPIELLRQWLNHGQWFDQKDMTKLEIVDVLLVAGMSSGRYGNLSQRFLHHLVLLGIPGMEDATLSRIFVAIIDWHFSSAYDSSITRLARSLVSATRDVYRSCAAALLPTPAKCHYVFSLQDVARVLHGVLLVPPSHLSDPGKLLRLWVHEVYRVFSDRLVEDVDRNTFFEVVSSQTHLHFKQTLESLLSHLNVGKSGGGKLRDEHVRNLLFVDYLNPDDSSKIYDEITDFSALSSVMEHYLAEYNRMHKTPLNMVMFKYAIEHISRISHVLKQGSGHLLLIGVSGCGRRYVVRLATFMAGYKYCSIEMAPGYTSVQWREDLKKVLMTAGADGQAMSFLFSDTQVTNDAMLEDVSMILHSGDIPNLFAADEKGEIMEKMQVKAKEMGRKVDAMSLSLYNFFVDRVRQNLHVVLHVSPLNPAFRSRLLRFPTLISCCTLDYFQAWPEGALEMVAIKFLDKVGLDETIRPQLVTLCMTFNSSVHRLANRFYEELGRRTYITPSSYLELILTFQSLLDRKQKELLQQRNRYLVGLEKLEFASAQVVAMQEELTTLQPQLVQTSIDTERLMIRIEQDTVEVEARKEVVAADEALANKAAAAAQAIKDDCVKDLAEAIPAMDTAIRALNTLRPQDITLVKSMKNPPEGVKLVLEAICIMKHVKPDKIPDPSGSGRMLSDYWGPSLRMLGELKFLDSLKSYDKDNISRATMKLIRDKFTRNPEFEPSKIRKVSVACEGLCLWVRAMDVYDRVARVVAPKKARLEQAESDLAHQLETLEDKKKQLQEVTDKLQSLNDQFGAMTKKKKDLEDHIELCSRKLERAERLLGGLSGERGRWKQVAAELSDLFCNIPGDALLAAGDIAYLGPFTLEFRQDCIVEWREACFQAMVPCSPQFSLITILGDQMTIQHWNQNGLPSDSFSVENAIISSNSLRWPLMIDPQYQANRWVKNMEGDQLVVIRLTDEDYTERLGEAVRTGRPVLLENILEDLDPVLDSVLLRQTFTQGGKEYIKFAEEEIEYNSAFRFFLTTRLRNPHYLPEISTKVMILNFMITTLGLEDQLLGIVAAKERPELEVQKKELLQEAKANSTELKNIEDRILKVLSTSEGNILEDETAIQVLYSSKLLSEDIQAKQAVTSATEKEIDAIRYGYQPAALHAAILFLCVSELVNVGPTYQYSLSWFLRLYLQSIEQSEVSDDLQQRIKNLNQHFTRSLFLQVSQSLFTKDRLLFSLLLTVVGVQRKNTDPAWRHLSAQPPAVKPSPHPHWLSDQSWSILAAADSFIPGLSQNVKQHAEEWYAVYNSSEPHLTQFPVELSGLERLVVLRAIRPDKVIPAVQEYISDTMGPHFVEYPKLSLRDKFEESSASSPLIFLLSGDWEPMGPLRELRLGISGGKIPCETVTLGRGQGPKAAKLIEELAQAGGWVVLQCCHLAPSWMSQLELLAEEVSTRQTLHPKFRLWLTTSPSPEFPASLLQNGLKMACEGPCGLKSSLLHSYLSPPLTEPTFFNGCNKPREWQKLMFGLCFFHATVQERGRYGSLGWNASYEFLNSDLKISLLQLQAFLNDYSTTPLNALHYLTGECNYGGRVTDSKDRTTLLTLLTEMVYNPDILRPQPYWFLGNEDYCLPTSADSHQDFVDYIRTLPDVTSPAVAGLNDNARLIQDIRETLKLLDGLRVTQPQQFRTELLEDSSLINTAQDILDRLPAQFDLAAVRERYPVQYDQSLHTVLHQEAKRYNTLVEKLRQTLVGMQQALAGQQVMTSDLEAIVHSLQHGLLPPAWAAVSYPCLRNLSGYVTDLLLRLAFFQLWIEDGKPECFLFSAFFFPQAFLTAILQNFARKHGLTISEVALKYSVLSPGGCGENYIPPEDDSVKIQGLFLEGASWCSESGALEEAHSKEHFQVFPPMLVQPRRSDQTTKVNTTNLYHCPVYQTPARQSSLSTTGHTTNYVMDASLNPGRQSPSHWILRGTALLCQPPV